MADSKFLLRNETHQIIGSAMREIKRISNWLGVFDACRSHEGETKGVSAEGHTFWLTPFSGLLHPFADECF